MLFSMSLTSCSEKDKQDSHTTFGFRNLSDSFDSKTGIFTRRYSEDSAQIKLVLTENERTKILKSFAENQFQYFPREIDCSSWRYHPTKYDYINLNDKTVRYTYNGLGNEGFFCIKGKRFHKVSKVIQDVIMNKSEVKKLKPSDVYYE